MTDMNVMREYLETLFQELGVVELRHQIGQRWESGLFDDPGKLLTEAQRRSGQGNLFTTLNPVKFRAVKNLMGTQAVADADVLRYARLFFDFDPIRQKDTSSTEAELCNAIAAADEAEQVFTALGFPAPARAVSGNGAHLQYRIALPNDAKIRNLLLTAYTGSKRDLSTGRVGFDSKVRNPSRICCLYGTIKRKGQPTDERPHRQSHIDIPQDWKQVSRKSLEGLAQFYARRHKTHSSPSSEPFTGGAGDYSTLDVVGWFNAHGHYKRHLGGGKHAVTCPWLAEHSSVDHPLKTDSVVWETDGGWPTFHCSHDHCEGRTIKDVMTLWSDADSFCTQDWRVSK